MIENRGEPERESPRRLYAKKIMLNVGKGSYKESNGFFTDKEERGRLLHRWTNLWLGKQTYLNSSYNKKNLSGVSQDVGDSFYNKCIYQIDWFWLFMAGLRQKLNSQKKFFWLFSEIEPGTLSTVTCTTQLR